MEVKTTWWKKIDGETVFFIAMACFFVFVFGFAIFTIATAKRTKIDPEDQAKKDAIGHQARVWIEDQRLKEEEKIAIENKKKELEDSKPTRLSKFKQGDVVQTKASKLKGQVVEVFWKNDKSKKWLYKIRFLPENEIIEVRDFEIEKVE